MYHLYATHKATGETVKLSISYNHSTRAEFNHQLWDSSGKLLATRYGHPKQYGVTKANGWTVEPDMKGPW